MQLAADNLIHGWDVAVAIGGDTRMDPHLVHAISSWFDKQEEAYRDAGAVSTRRELTGDAQHDLLARFGRDAMAFVNSPVGRQLNLRGINARVVTPGRVRQGDPVVRLDP